MGDESAEQSMTIEDFITAYPLPQRAKVTAGYLPDDDEDVPDFSTGDVIDIKRVLCPFVSLSFTNPQTKQLVTISTSASYKDKFTIVSQSDIKKVKGSYTFENIQELIQVWPRVFTAIPEQSNASLQFTRSHKLRLIRIMPKVENNSVERSCEFSNLTTLQLFQLPLSYKGKFVEEKDTRSYTLRELIDIAPVARTLKLVDKKNISIPGIPISYDDNLKLEKPKFLLQVKRIIEDPDETDNNIEDPYTMQDILLPVATDIELSRREDVYSPKCGVSCNLRDNISSMFINGSFVVQIQSWDEETTILQNHVTMPGTFLLVHRQETQDKVLAHCDKRFFLIPVKHNGTYRPVESDGLLASKAFNMSTLSRIPFPSRAKYSPSAEYVNQADDVLPTTEILTLDVFFAEETILVSNMMGDVIQRPYHLPLRTGLCIRYIRRWRTPEQQPISERDDFVEELSFDRFDELIAKVCPEYECPTLPRVNRYVWFTVLGTILNTYKIHICTMY